MKTIILSCAHGEEVAGKRSPDGKHREYLWSRNIQYRIAQGLTAYGVDVILIPAKNVMTEPGLWNRVTCENTIENAFVFSLHNNAAGNGTKWMTARGVEGWTCKGQTKSDPYGEMILTDLKEEFPEIVHWRFDMRDGDKDKEENFVELMSKHPSFLLEFLFQDNVLDVAMLQDPKMQCRLVNCMIKSLLKIAQS